MKNIFIITQSEPFYIPKMVKMILENQSDKYRIVGYSLLSPNRKNKSIFHWFKERYNIYNLKELFFVGNAFVYAKFSNYILKNNSPYSSKVIFENFKIPRFETEDINDPGFISELKKLNIDHIVSISCPQLFKQDLIEVSKICPLNAHGTLLPKHKGVFGSWWMLFEGDKEGGSTIHKLALKLDSGSNVWQKSFNIEKCDTQYSIAYKTKRDMTYGLIELFSKNELFELKPMYTQSYHRAPTKELGKKFHKQGKKVLVFKDLKNMLKPSFE